MKTKEEIETNIRELVRLKKEIESIQQEYNILKEITSSDITEYNGVSSEPFTLEYDDEILESYTYIEDYLEQRYPGSELISIDKDLQIIYAKYPEELQKTSFEIKDLVKFEKRISQSAPSVNLELLKEKAPKFFEQVTSQKTYFDDEKFGELLADDLSNVPSALYECIEGKAPRISIYITDLDGEK